MTLKWELQPKIGWGPLRFGMTQADVASLVGPPVTARPDHDGSVTEFRAVHEPSLTYRDGLLIDISSDKYCHGLTIGGVDIYAATPAGVVRLLLSRDPSPMELLGGLFFPVLTVNCNGFYDFAANRPLTPEEVKDDDYRSLSAATPGSFDDLREEMTVPPPLRVEAP